MKDIVLKINDVPMHLRAGMSLDDWETQYGDNTDLWDAPLAEYVDGTLEPDADMVYWLIGSRVYETTEVID